MDKEKILEAARSMLGREYKFGAKWPLDNPDPEGPVDCSGFVRWCFAMGGKKIPDGSYEQYRTSRELNNIRGERPNPCDLGFFLRQGVAHHVGILEDDYWVLEARGNPYERVIRRPRAKWEAFHEFSGWRRIDA